eukprot:GEMP01020018.1.p1 GENE.GEMP01020018.1~~GEMP01020018.1.p1  ORF type:complete len:519 (+),score=164.63 GEMP01020018.1:167-1723(+)
MGNAYMKAAKVDKEVVDASGLYAHGVASMQGWRRTMEDAHTHLPFFDTKRGLGLFCVFDGHGGQAVAKIVANRLPTFLKNNDFYKKKQYSNALTAAFLEMDKYLDSPEGRKEVDGMEPPDPEEAMFLSIPLDIREKLRKGQPIDPKEFERDDVPERVKQLVRSEVDSSDDDDDDNNGGCDGGIVVGHIDDDDDDVDNDEENDSESEASTVALEDLQNGANLAAAQDVPSVELDMDGDSDGSELMAYEGEAMPIKERSSPDGMGCTAIVVLLQHRAKGVRAWIANCGDSRAVLSRGGKAYALSKDHKPTLPSEQQRIMRAGGFVNEEGRVDGNLNLSRALGDLFYKRGSGGPEDQKICGVPHVKHASLKAIDEFIIIGCDGIWESLTNQEMVDFVRHHTTNGKDDLPLSTVASKVLDSLVASNPKKTDGLGCDNMSMIILRPTAGTVLDVRKNDGPKVEVQKNDGSEEEVRKNNGSEEDEEEEEEEEENEEEQEKQEEQEQEEDGPPKKKRKVSTPMEE